MSLRLGARFLDAPGLCHEYADSTGPFAANSNSFLQVGYDTHVNAKRVSIDAQILSASLGSLIA